MFEPQPEGAQRSLRQFRYMMEPRKVRHLFWHALTDQGWFSHPMEFMIFSPGYPAQVVLRSGFIDLGQVVGDGRPKGIRQIFWDADLPPNTRLQLRSRAGNTLEDVFTFFDRLGNEISEDEWSNKPNVLRGPVDTTVVAGADWGGLEQFLSVFR